MEDQAIYHVFRHFPKVSTDTRQIMANSLFFALKGETFDGNQFAAEALEKGARYAVVDDPSVVEDERYLLVNNVLEALQHLANHHRKTLNIPVIGLTGTNGKTTTKELIRSVLSQKYNVSATKGNLNNQIGVPLTLLEIGQDVDIAIIEMGANHIGEIAFLCEIAEPTHGLITNIGQAHLEGFGDLEGVKRGKGELYAYLSSRGGEVFLQGDNTILLEIGAKHFGEHFAESGRFHTYGISPTNDLQGEVLSANPFLKLKWGAKGTSRTVQTQLAGEYNIDNVLAAAAVGLHFGVEPTQIDDGLAAYRPSNNRSQVIDTAQGNRVFGDYYNANASSMRAALQSFAGLEDSRPKVLILGDMFEMGGASASAHLDVVKSALAMQPAEAIFIGNSFYEHRAAATSEDLPKGSEYSFFKTLAEAKVALQTKQVQNAVILVKGSRGIALEGLIGVL